MKRLTRIGLLALAMGLGVTAVLLMVTGLSPAAAAGEIDLTLDMQAPAHITADLTYVVRIGYFNFGTEMAPDAWVTATLPVGTQFVTATNRWGAPLPPDVTDGNNLTWYFVRPLCQWPGDACCGHILITLQSDETLPEGELLTTTATIATTAAESDTTNNSASVTSMVCDMAGSAKQVQARHVMPGDVLTYTITISPARRLGGGANTRWVTLTDTLPFSHQVRFLGWSGMLTGTQIDGHMLSWQGQVYAGQPLTIQYQLGVEGVVTPGTVITNMARLGWEGRHMQLGPVTTVVTLPQGTMALGPYQGGQLHHQYGVTLTVPPGAVTDTTRFQFRPLFTDTRPISPPGGLLFAHRAFELTAFRFGQDVRQFGQPLTITLNYTDTDVLGLKRETLRLWTRTAEGPSWAMLGEPARVMSGALTFTTMHFSQFALFGEARYKAYLPLVARR
ncbi:MAG: hypothetical protein ISS49_09050 [Anaerolineae bacterium]|nr:hypothetical protein [Anaerolineae bacterium]